MDPIKELKNMKNIDKDALLDALGLQTRRGPLDSLLPALGFFGAGIAVGTGLGILMAPRSGREMRKRLKRGIEDVGDRATSAISEQLGR